MEDIQESSRFKPKSRRSADDSASPEFDFWRLQTNNPQLDLVSADDLFVDGVLVPQNNNKNYASNHQQQPDPTPKPDPEQITATPTTSSSSSAAAPLHVSSKRWRDMFKKTEKKKKTTKDKKSGGGPTTSANTGGGGASSAELNINLWPFSRSRSAGNACTRPRPSFGAPITTRKVNSAPCSRSNSTGESKSTRKWPASPGRPGVHLGRSSPVWQVRRPKTTTSEVAVAHHQQQQQQLRNAEKSGADKKDARRRAKTTTTAVGGGGRGGGSGGAKPTRVLNLNVPTCIGYRSHLSCRSDVMHSAVGIGGSSSNNNRGGAAVTGGGHDGGGADSSSNNGGGVAGGNLFNLRSLFSKKVY